jgi:hypothetical protein
MQDRQTFFKKYNAQDFSKIKMNMNMKTGASPQTACHAWS